MLKLCICYSYLSNIYIHICIYIYSHIYIYNMYIYFQIFTCICIHITNIHTWSYRIIQMYIYIYKYIKGNTHIPGKKCLLTLFPPTNIWEKNLSFPQVRSCIGWSEEGELFGRAASDLWGTRWHFGVGKILKVHLNKSPRVVTTRINWGPLKTAQGSVYCPGGDVRGLEPNFFRLVSSDETAKTPSLLGGFLVLSFGVFPFIFFLGVVIFLVPRSFEFLGGGGFWEAWDSG